MSEKPPTVYGIDLGTTYSCIAYFAEYGKPTVINNQEGKNITPSVVFFDGNTRVVGIEAKNVAQTRPDQVVEMVKRQMGDGEWRFHYDGIDYRAEEISSFILRKLVGDAEAAVGEKITDVVITCPAYFGINEREATAQAGKIAGLNVRSIINEPTAAAIAYGVHQDKDMVVLVYDLGGGTFDITMIEIKAGEINVIATGGNHHLGGRNWDEVIVNYLANEWMAQTGSSEDPLDDPETLQDLFGRAETAKQTLSNPARDKTDVAVTHAGQRVAVTLSREKFNELTRNLLEETIDHTHRMLKEAEKKGHTHFDQFLLVGGSTRMMQVTERVRVEFSVEPKIVDPDEIVAKGAALYGQKLAIDEEIKIKVESWGFQSPEAVPEKILEKAQTEVAEDRGMVLPSVQRMSGLAITNVTSHSFGVEAISRDTNQIIISNLIRVNDKVPVEVKQRFGTAEANQETAEIRIMENVVSEAKASPEASQEIGMSVLPLPPGLPEGSPIEITFHLNEQGRLHATALELTTRKAIEAEVQTKRVISQDELVQAKARATKLVVS